MALETVGGMSLDGFPGAGREWFEWPMGYSSSVFRVPRKLMASRLRQWTLIAASPFELNAVRRAFEALQLAA